MTQEEKERYMQRCFQLATLGNGHVAPNPMVGCVIVHDGKIIAEGYHRQFGGPHAEVNALNAVKDKSLLATSTVFVNLEPCSHYGKTPPCALRLVKEGVKKVIICNLDPNPQVAGKGVKILQEAGIEVETGILQEEGWALNIRFFTFFTQHRPYVILKWAQTADGFIDANLEQPIQISTEITKALVHQLRSQESAILVGTRTALKDNPQLHTRRWFGKHPLRLVIDRNLSIPAHYHLLDGQINTVIINALKTEEKEFPAPAKDANKTTLSWVKMDFSHQLVAQILNYLYEHQISSLIVEGGKITLEKWMESGWYDVIQVEKGKQNCGQGTLAPALDINLHTAQTCQIGDGEFIIYTPKHGNA